MPRNLKFLSPFQLRLFAHLTLIGPPSPSVPLDFRYTEPTGHDVLFLYTLSCNGEALWVLWWVEKLNKKTMGAVFKSSVLVVSYLPATFEVLCITSFRRFRFTSTGGLLCILASNGLCCAFTGSLDLFGIATELTGSSCPLQQHCKDLPSYLL